MGECNYYLKARFKDAETAAIVVPRLTALLAEGEKAYRYWQGSRRGNGPTVPASEFWAGFREQFPLATGYLRELAGIGDWDNGLSGHLSCLIDPRKHRRFDHSASLVQSDNLVLLQLKLIWHGTDMGLLERYCREDLRAVAVGSISVEDLDVDEDSDLEEDGPTERAIDPFEAIWV